MWMEWIAADFWIRNNYFINKSLINGVYIYKMKKFARFLIHTMHMRFFYLFYPRWITSSFFSGFPYTWSHVNITACCYIAFHSSDGVYLFLIHITWNCRDYPFTGSKDTTLLSVLHCTFSTYIMVISHSSVANHHHLSWWTVRYI